MFQFYRINLMDASMTCLLCDARVIDPIGIRNHYCPNCKSFLDSEVLDYVKVRKDRFEAVQNYGNHFRVCEQCGLSPGECEELEKLEQIIQSTAQRANPKWFQWVLNRLPRTARVPGWKFIREMSDGGMYLKDPNWTVLISGDFEDDGKRWMHYSTSRLGGRQLPSWADIKEVKEVFVGRENLAIQVFPPEDKYINMREGLTEVLHLWSPADGLDLPDFTRGGTVL